MDYSGGLQDPIYILGASSVGTWCGPPATKNTRHTGQSCSMVENIALDLQARLTLSAIVAQRPTGGAPGHGGRRAALELSLLALAPPPAAEERAEGDEGDQDRGRRDGSHGHRLSVVVAAAAVGGPAAFLCLASGRGAGGGDKGSWGGSAYFHDEKTKNTPRKLRHERPGTSDVGVMTCAGHPMK